MIVRGESTIIDYHAPFDQGFTILFLCFRLAFGFDDLEDYQNTDNIWVMYFQPFLKMSCKSNRKEIGFPYIK